jgi:nucleotide-binding universal stress UspA family protein
VLLCRADASARESGNDAPSIDARTPLLCALDGSAFAEALLPHAVRFAQTLAVPLHLFSVVTPRALDLAPFATEALLADPDGLAGDEDDRAAYLDGVADRLRAIQDGLEVTRQVTTDMRPAQAIHDEVVRVGACAVAMSTHARGGLTRLVLGSVTDVVVRECRAPVLVVRTDAPTAG